MTTPVAAPLTTAENMGWRGWVGFMSMVLGMFMAILDIQIVSASISEIQAGLRMRHPGYKPAI